MKPIKTSDADLDRNAYITFRLEVGVYDEEVRPLEYAILTAKRIHISSAEAGS
jgi:hypothetical protein